MFSQERQATDFAELVATLSAQEDSLAKQIDTPVFMMGVLATLHYFNESGLTPANISALINEISNKKGATQRRP